VARAELAGCADAQAAVNLYRGSHDLVAREVDVGQHGADALVETLSGSGGSAAPRRASDKLHAQRLLQVREQAAHRLQRAAQPTRSGGEAAAFDHGDICGISIERCHELILTKTGIVVTTRAARSMRDRWTTTMSRATFEARRGHGFERE